MSSRKYVFSKVLRRSYIGISALFLAGLFITIILTFSHLMKIAPIDSPEEKMQGEFIALIWIVIMVASIKPLAKSAYSIDYMRLKYTCGMRTKVACLAHEYSVDLHQPFFLCRIPLFFLMNRDGHILNFFLLSNRPIIKECVKWDGIEALHVILTSGAVLIPENEETIAWVSDILHLPQPSTYPRVRYHSGLTHYEME